MYHNNFFTTAIAAFRCYAATALLFALSIFLVTLNAPAAKAGTLPEQLKCKDGEEFSNGFCYKPCDSGYEGVGPVCWQKCPSGYTNRGVFCDMPPITKESYGRGAGKIKNGCPNGKVNEDGLCYTPCPSGWKGVGPVCWKGIKSQTRGAGSVPNSCPSGTEADGALCYPTCKIGYDGVGPVCWQKCPSGYTNSGVFCSKTLTKASYGRGAGYAASNICSGKNRKYDTNYTSQLSQFTDTKRFTLLIASDPQMPWWMEGRDPDCNSADCVLAKSKQVNGEQVKAMNNITNTTWFANSNTGKGQWPNATNITYGGALSQPLALIMNGDLTAYWHADEAKLYRQYYETDYTAGSVADDYKKPDSDPSLKLPIFPGLGNHDYQNNLNDCYGMTADSNHCAKSAVNYIKDMVYCDEVGNFINTLVSRFDDKSLAYSWDIGNFHFVQLHNYPTYTAKEVDIESAIEWLKNDLVSATADGKKIVLNMHDYDAVAENADFKNAIKGHSIVALFAGHKHEKTGWLGNVTNTDAAGKSYEFPYFFSGSSDYQTFLLVEFTDTYMNVGVISSKDGKPVFVGDGFELDPATDPKRPRRLPIELPATFVFE
jgi:cytolysin (calcineurin-like family phosphatase)